MFFIYLALTVFIRMNGMHEIDFIDLPSMLFVAAGWLFIFASYQASEVIWAFLQALGIGSSTQSPQLSMQVLSDFAKYGVLAGGVCTLLGVVQALGNLEDVKLLGAALALSLLGLLFALLVYLILILPLQNSLRRQIIESEIY